MILNAYPTAVEFVASAGNGGAPVESPARHRTARLDADAARRARIAPDHRRSLFLTLCRAAHGVIEPHYDDYWGNRVEAPESTRRALFAAVGCDEFSQAGDAQTLPPVIVVRSSEVPVLPEPVELWSVDLEDGSTFAGDFRALPLGYHRLTRRAGGSETDCALIVVPAQCYLPASMRRGRVWALSTQLYALRSSRNWGIGDFTDLAAFARIAGAAGAGALATQSASRAALRATPRRRARIVRRAGSFSTCSTSTWKTSRSWRNRRRCGLRLPESTFRGAWSDCEPATLVDYSRRRQREARASSNRSLHALPCEPFRASQRRACSRLSRFRSRARYGARAAGASTKRSPNIFARAILARMGGTIGRAITVRRDSPSVARFARGVSRTCRFLLLPQWIAHRQLAQAARSARQHHVALYCDLAVGVDRNSADAWSRSGRNSLRRIARRARRSAQRARPELGSRAALTERAARRAYEPFVALLRANMRYAGILRIDHVMALRVPSGFPAARRLRRARMCATLR